MNYTFAFNADEVKALLNKSELAEEYVATNDQAYYKELRKDGLDSLSLPLYPRPHWTDVDPAKLEPGLILVAGRGVYLVSNDANQDWKKGSYESSYAKWFNPSEDLFDDWSERVNVITDGYDYEIFIHATEFQRVLSSAGEYNTIVIDYDDESDEILFKERFNIIIECSVSDLFE